MSRSSLGLPSTGFEERKRELILIGDPPCSSRVVCFDGAFALPEFLILMSPFSWSGNSPSRLAVDRVRRSGTGAPFSRGARGASVRRLLAVCAGNAKQMPC